MTVTMGQLACTQRKLRYHSTDEQTDVQDVPVDGDSLIRRLAILLIYQCMSVPKSGTTILSGHHKFCGSWFKALIFKRFDV